MSTLNEDLSKVREEHVKNGIQNVLPEKARERVRQVLNEPNVTATQLFAVAMGMLVGYGSSRERSLALFIGNAVAGDVLQMMDEA